MERQGDAASAEAAGPEVILNSVPWTDEFNAKFLAVRAEAHLIIRQAAQWNAAWGNQRACAIDSDPEMVRGRLVVGVAVTAPDAGTIDHVRRLTESPLWVESRDYAGASRQSLDQARELVFEKIETVVIRVEGGKERATAQDRQYHLRQTRPCRGQER